MEKTHAHAKEIVLVRHGETRRNSIQHVGRFVANTEELHHAGILPDHKVTLSSLGKVQAQCIGEAIRKHLDGYDSYDAYFDSGYVRTVQTMDHILEQLGLDREADERRRSHLDLREREPGYPFNMTITQINRYFPWYQEYASIMGKFYERPPGGESVADVCQRVHMFLNSLRRARDNQRVFIVAHGRVMLAFRYWLEKQHVRDVEDFFKQEQKGTNKIRNCEVLIYKRRTDTEKVRFDPQSEIQSRIMDEFDVLLSQKQEQSEKRKGDLVKLWNKDLKHLDDMAREVEIKRRLKEMDL